jgi:histidine triad (HIT) family protein|tara:strand:+ start:1602 stop:1940 length:339 start_codon:yes stop_codon:yes gene_type:complete
MEQSIFEKILVGEISSEIIYEDDFVFAINDINPVARIHILVIPKKRIDTLNQMNEEDTTLLGHMVLVAKNLAKEQKIDDTGYRILMNTNSDAGQTVYHIHLHLIGGEELKGI